MFDNWHIAKTFKVLLVKKILKIWKNKFFMFGMMVCPHALTQWLFSYKPSNSKPIEKPIVTWKTVPVWTLYWNWHGPYIVFFSSRVFTFPILPPLAPFPICSYEHFQPPVVPYHPLGLLWAAYVHLWTPFWTPKSLILTQVFNFEAGIWIPNYKIYLCT